MIELTIAIILLSGIVFAIQRVLNNKRSGNSLKKTLSKLAAQPEHAIKIAEKLDCFIGRHDSINEQTLSVVLDKMKYYTQLGKYEVHGVYPAGNATFLIVTLCKDHNASTDLAGFAAGTELSMTNFRIKVNPEKQLISLYTHQYSNREEERLLKEFSKDFFAALEKATVSVSQPL